MIRSTASPDSQRPALLGCAVLTGLAAAVVWTLSPIAAPAQSPPLSPEEKAGMVLNSARLACNERNYPVAIERFRAFLKDFGGDRRAASARRRSRRCTVI